MDATSGKRCDISILVPFYNEEENLSENYEQIRRALEKIPETAEIIYIDDGSTDKGADVIKKAAASDPRVKLVSFSKNFGQTAAMEAAFKSARGTIYVTLDADNQNDPADIPLLLDKMREGYGVVSGWREKRKDGFFLRRLPSVIANRLISKITGVELKDYGCTLKAYDARYIDPVNLYGEMHRFIPAYAKHAGAKVTEVAVNHRPRTKGVSKYGLNRTIKVILDLITVKFLGSYAAKPIYFFGGAGFFLMALSFLVTLFVAYQKFFRDVFVHRNPLFTLAVFVFLLGVMLVMMGVLAEIMARTYYESQGKKPYLVKETVGF
jgi:glycosyltransferase involved in cell wall biosynthesis